MPAGIGVVTDVGDTVLSEMAAADFEHLVLHCRGHPGEDAVTDDVIELAEIVANFENVDMLQLDVLQP